MRASAAVVALCALLAVWNGSTSTTRPVGFRVLAATDTSRTETPFPKGRPIQIALWYPAAAAGTPLTYRDYVVLAAEETSSSSPSGAAEAIADFESFLAPAGVTKAEADAFLATTMRASRDARPASGVFPLVLVAQGNGQSAHDQAFLAEVLAGRGYAVATTPSQTRVGPRMTSEEEIPAQAQAQAADLAFALRALRTEAPVRPGPYAVAGHSFGARSALLLAMQDPDVAAVVSLDGGIGGKAGNGRLEKAPGFAAARATAPLLHLYEEGDRFMIPDFDLLRSLSACDRWLVRVDGLRHVHFTSAGVMVRSMPALARATSAGDDVAPAWDAVAAAAASFLDRSLASQRDRAASWTPPPSPLLHVEFLPAAGPVRPVR